MRFDKGQDTYHYTETTKEMYRRFDFERISALSKKDLANQITKL